MLLGNRVVLGIVERDAPVRNYDVFIIRFSDLEYATKLVWRVK